MDGLAACQRDIHIKPWDEIASGPLSSDLRQRWDELLETNKNLYAVYGSPDWFSHLQATEDQAKAPRLFVAYDQGETPIGFLPLRLGRTCSLSYRLPWGFYHDSLQVHQVLGGEPLAAGSDERVYDYFFTYLHQCYPNGPGLYFHSVPKDRPMWAYLQQSPVIERYFICHSLDGLRPFYSVALPKTHAEYLAQFNKKKRYNLKRQVKLLQAEGQGVLTLKRIETVDQVETFTADAEKITRHAWQQRDVETLVQNPAQFQKKLKDLASRRLLRSYLLYAGAQPCAFVLGYQSRGVYHYADIRYAQALAHFSPGTCLLYLLIEDLFAHQPVRTINFGIGYSKYKEEFGNQESADSSFVLLPKTGKNLVRLFCHASYRALMDKLRQCRDALTQRVRS